MTTDSTPTPTLAQLALEAHRAKVREHEARAAQRERAREAEHAALRKTPQELGLEECPDCGWWREPVPSWARASLDTFRTYLAVMRVRCLCTADRCKACGEPILKRHPTPFYYDPVEQRVIRSGSAIVSMGHRSRCRRSGS